MTSQRKTRGPNPRAHALEVLAEARRLEAVAARAQAEAYDALAQACAQRAQALKVVSLADQAVARLCGSQTERTWAGEDGQRATVHAGLMEREVSLHTAQARRAEAEGARAEAEADASSQKAHMTPFEVSAPRPPLEKGG